LGENRKDPKPLGEVGSIWGPNKKLVSGHGDNYRKQKNCGEVIPWGGQNFKRTTYIEFRREKALRGGPEWKKVSE